MATVIESDRNASASGTSTSAPTRDDTDVIGKRIGAQIVDTVVMLVAFAVVAFAFSALGGLVGGASGDSSAAASAFMGMGMLGALVGFAVSFFYGFLLEGYWDGYTIGKKIFGIRVLKEDGSACGYGGAFLRNVLEIIDGLFYYVVGFVFMAMGDKRQRLGDRVAGTVVVGDSN